MNLKPVEVGCVNLLEPTKYIHILREGIFSLIYNWGIEVYSIDPVKGTRMSVKKKFEMPKQEIKLFQVPEPIDNIINIFF